MFEVHNLESGRFAGGGGSNTNQGDENDAISETHVMLDKITSTFNTIEFYPELALVQVLDAYAIATDLVNALQKKGDIPFGEAHHIAAALVNFGRSRGLRRAEIIYSDFENIFTEAAEHLAINKKDSGLTEVRFRKLMTPQAMVEAAKGLGGPQEASVNEMLQEGARSISESPKWLSQDRDKLKTADDLLDAAFSKL